MIRFIAWYALKLVWGAIGHDLLIPNIESSTILSNDVAKDIYFSKNSELSDSVERLKEHNKDIEAEKDSEEQLKLSCDFIEWFIGFTDTEGCFQITPQRSGSAFEFRFSFGLHLFIFLLFEK